MILQGLHQDTEQFQPVWPNKSTIERAKTFISEARPLIPYNEVQELLQQTERVHNNEQIILQVGDCAEPFAEMTPAPVKEKLQLIQRLSDYLSFKAGKPVLKIARIGGQFAKPRSSLTEEISGIEIPSYFGDLINGARPDFFERTPDANRIILGYLLAESAQKYIRDINQSQEKGGIIWTSHEALVLDYEYPQLRKHHSGTYLSSTHFPWIGNRTRQLTSKHVALLAGVDNPIACKIGDGIETSEAIALAELLNPRRKTGRVVFIARFGIKTISSKLPPIVAAIRASGIPVVWILDPLHGNTVKTATGVKTRIMRDIISEVSLFREILEDANVNAAGLHLEVTGSSDLIECIEDHVELNRNLKNELLCDPRLNEYQAIRVLRAWSEGVSE